MEIGLLFVVAIATYSYLGPLHLVVVEMKKGPLYPSSAPVVKVVPELLCLVPEVSSSCELSQSLVIATGPLYIW